METHNPTPNRHHDSASRSQLTISEENREGGGEWKEQREKAGEERENLFSPSFPKRRKRLSAESRPKWYLDGGRDQRGIHQRSARQHGASPDYY